MDLHWNIKEKNWSWTVTMYQRPHSCFSYYFYTHRMEKSPKQHSSMPCMAEAMSKIKTAASTTQYSGSESSYININGGMCTWDPDIETSVDVCDFKQTIESARHEKSQKTKMEIYAKAWKLYTGEFLPDMMGEDWAAVENIACRDMYFDCVEELCHYLKTEEKFEELYRVAHSAAEIYPFYDWQIWEIDSLIGMSRYKDGLDVYKRTTKLMFDELGLSPSAGMLERFKLMGERTSQAAGAIEDIKYRLREKESIEGAYYCTYPSFVDVYHVFGRMMERTGMSVFLMLCTLDFTNIEADDENQKYYSELLRESIQKAVRKGDFYTRYNIQQYLVMLIGITQENCTLVSKRINIEFNKRLTRRKNVSIDYYVASLGEVCDTEATNNDRRTS